MLPKLIANNLNFLSVNLCECVHVYMCVGGCGWGCRCVCVCPCQNYNSEFSSNVRNLLTWLLIQNREPILLLFWNFLKWGQVSEAEFLYVCNLGCRIILSLDQTILEQRNPPTFASQALSLKVYAITSGSKILF